MLPGDVALSDAQVTEAAGSGLCIPSPHPLMKSSESSSENTNLGLKDKALEGRQIFLVPAASSQNPTLKLIINYGSLVNNLGLFLTGSYKPNWFL